MSNSTSCGAANLCHTCAAKLAVCVKCEWKEVRAFHATPGNFRYSYKIVGVPNYYFVYSRLSISGLFSCSKKGEIAISPTYFVTVLISSVIWPNTSTIFLLATFAISPNYSVIFKITKTVWPVFFITNFLTTFFSSPNSCAISISPRLLFKLDKKVWPKD